MRCEKEERVRRLWQLRCAISHPFVGIAFQFSQPEGSTITVRVGETSSTVGVDTHKYERDPSLLLDSALAIIMP